MSATETTRADPRERNARPAGKPSGRLTVDDYVGRAASEAAQAVRRAGLRPGMDRSLGHKPALAGQVIAQEPEPGSALARNGLVTLFVAAPDTGPAADDRDAEEPGVRSAGARRSRPRAGQARSGRAKRRGRQNVARGHAAAAPPPRGGAPTVHPDAVGHGDGDRIDDSQRALSDETLPDDREDELLYRAEELFARRATGAPHAWRGLHPGADTLRGPALLQRRSLLVRAFWMAVAIWLVIAVAAAVFGHGVVKHRMTRAKVIAAPPPAVATVASRMHQRLGRHTPRPERKLASRRGPTRRRPQPVRVVTVVVPVWKTSVVAPSPATRAPASELTPAVEQHGEEQSGGGPFAP